MFECACVCLGIYVQSGYLNWNVTCWSYDCTATTYIALTHSHSRRMTVYYSLRFTVGKIIKQRMTSAWLSSCHVTMDHTGLPRLLPKFQQSPSNFQTIRTCSLPSTARRFVPLLKTTRSCFRLVHWRNHHPCSSTTKRSSSWKGFWTNDEGDGGHSTSYGGLATGQKKIVGFHDANWTTAKRWISGW
jgi:hypothetical protein